MQKNKAFQPDFKLTPGTLGEAIQQAIEIEIATIPVYLYTYYSINRTPNQQQIITDVSAALVKQGKPEAEAKKEAEEISASIMVFANKAGALIMSVAIEEMLHMALSSNLKQSLVGLPELVGKTPKTWPAYLPGHEPEFPINKGRLSLPQLMTFLEIESPSPLPDKTKLLKAIPYKTIGQFYDMIVQYIEHNELAYNKDAPQLIPGKGYYAQNNVDTIFYDKHHKPHLVNDADSGDLVLVEDRASALKAIHIIVEQGEGNQDAPGLNPDYTVNCSISPADYDDPAMKEFSHFEKFSRIYCHYDFLTKKFAGFGMEEKQFAGYFVQNVALNPVTADYPANIQTLSNLLNAIYTYIFVMSEGCYKKAGHTQYEIFMFGIHKSMIFILNSLCGDIMQQTYTDKKDGLTYKAAPTFEDYAFDPASSPKSQLIALHAEVVKVFPGEAYLGQRFQDLPDVAL